MQLLSTQTVPTPGGPRFLRLYHGDLAAIPAREAVDMLIVSAFPGDYLPSRTSLVGALHRKGISVAALADDMDADFRAAAGCWVSRDLSDAHPEAGFRRLLCFEPLTRGAPAEVVGDIFRAVVPFALADAPIRSIAMPVLAAGDQGNELEEMLRAVVDAATKWLSRGLPLEEVKIVVYREDEVTRALRLFERATSGTAASAPPAPAPSVSGPARGDEEVWLEIERGAHGAAYDVFVSYSRDDSAEVDVLVQSLTAARPGLRVFLDRLEIDPGEVWQTEIDEALERCRKVIAVYSPSYFDSRMCMEEFNMARLRHREQGDVIIPIYLRTAELKLYPRSLNYVDCREADLDRVRGVCGRLLDALQPN